MPLVLLVHGVRLEGLELQAPLEFLAGEVLKVKGVNQDLLDLLKHQGT